MTKAKTKAEKLRDKRARFAALAAQATPTADNTDFAPSGPPIKREGPIRPTPERMAHGTWAAMPDDARDVAPMIDLAQDMIGALYASKQITSAQHDAARLFQTVLGDYLAEFAVPGYRSCLAGGTGGVDNSDGDPEAFRAHRAMQKKLGVTRYWYLRTECEKGPDRRPQSVELLGRALDAINA
jgi:hypothetical protein